MVMDKDVLKLDFMCPVIQLLLRVPRRPPVGRVMRSFGVQIRKHRENESDREKRKILTSLCCSPKNK